jgi:hypothetical protein
MVRGKAWGQCKTCRRWGWAPDGFNEGKHFLLCPCGSTMYLTVAIDPVKDLAMREQDRVTPTLTSIKEKP